MCSEPMMRAPFSGWASAYSARVCIRPGISCSASSISLRPKAARREVGDLEVLRGGCGAHLSPRLGGCQLGGLGEQALVLLLLEAQPVGSAATSSGSDGLVSSHASTAPLSADRGSGEARSRRRPGSCRARRAARAGCAGAGAPGPVQAVARLRAAGLDQPLTLDVAQHSRATNRWSAAASLIVRPSIREATLPRLCQGWGWATLPHRMAHEQEGSGSSGSCAVTHCGRSRRSACCCTTSA